MEAVLNHISVFDGTDFKTSKNQCHQDTTVVQSEHAVLPTLHNAPQLLTVLQQQNSLRIIAAHSLLINAFRPSF